MEKRMLKRVLATLCIISLILPMLSVISFAADETETKQFGISKTDNNGVGYKIYENGEEKQVYRTYVIENSAKDYSKGIFCLEKNKDFPGESTQTAVDYENKGDYTEKTEILKIADNMYLPYLSDSEKDAILNKIFAKRIADGADELPPVTLGLIKEHITENDILFAEQLAIWKYTDGYEWNNNIHFTVDGTNWMQYSDDQTKITLMKDVFEYFVTKNNELQLASSLTDISLVKSSKETIKLNDGRYAVGPFKMTGTNTNYTAKLYNQSGEEITNYTLVNKQGNTLGTNVKTLGVNNEFYVVVDPDTT
ncbi:MAG: thioester domain-containing protein, partial [Clostridia bacterium]|nr:thioester domain-containing protein [Clostridia bacterium]